MCVCEAVEGGLAVVQVERSLVVLVVAVAGGVSEPAIDSEGEGEVVSVSRVRDLVSWSLC